MPNNKRLSDKTEPFKIILTVIPIIFSAIMLYVLIPLKTDIKDMKQELKSEMQELKTKQEENMKKIYEFSGQCKEDVNQVRKEYKEDITRILEKMYAWVKAKS
jgi:uncharacterized membrane protein (DUF106 family)